MTRVLDVSGYDPLTDRLFGLDVLYQDERWQDAEGIVWWLEDMRPSHRANLLAFLRRRAFSLAMQDAMAALASPMAPRGEIASEDFDRALDWQCCNAGEWLDDTPLVKRLAALVTADEKADAERAKQEVGF